MKMVIQNIQIMHILNILFTSSFSLAAAILLIFAACANVEGLKSRGKQFDCRNCKRNVINNKQILYQILKPAYTEISPGIIRIPHCDRAAASLRSLLISAFNRTSSSDMVAL